MESLGYPSEGRGLLVSDDIELLDDAPSRSKNLLKEWNVRPFSDFYGNFSSPIKETAESIEFMGSGLPDMPRKSHLNDPCFGVLDDESSKHLASSSTITLNSLEETRYSSRFCSSEVRVDNGTLPKSDLEMENQVLCKEASGSQFSKENSTLSSPEPAVSVKRARITNLLPPAPVCQVYGCNKDLSSSKDYHKRHKVCDVHSKTAIVIVNGIEQRFCQQCSRFHLLEEFDEGKRSCRKRLAGHNERRRKPQLDTRSGSMFLAADLPNTSGLFSNFLPSNFFYQRSNGPCNQTRYIKLEKEPHEISQLAVSMRFEQSSATSLLHMHGMGKQYPSKNCLNAPLSLQHLNINPNSNDALSLLSAQSQNSLSTPAGMAGVLPLTFKENYHTNFKSPKALDISDLKNFGPQGFFPSGAVHRNGYPLDIQREISQRNNLVNLKHCIAPEIGQTVDLHELSLHLQRIEQQRNCTQVKQENNMCCSAST